MPIRNKELVLNKTKELMLSSTSHGLPNIFRTERKSLKIMWLFVFSLSSAFCMFTVIQAIKNYLDFEVVTKIEVIHESPTEFPTITFINSKNRQQDILKNLKFCYYNFKECNISDFETIVDEKRRLSYKFKTKQAFSHGPNVGLQIAIYLENSNPYYNDTYSLNTEGLKILVHNYSSDPEHLFGTLNEGILVSSGFYTEISVNRIYSFKLGLPYSDCLKDVKSINSFDSDLYKYIIEKNEYEYRQKNCFDYCIGEELNKYLNISNKIDHWQNVLNFSSKEMRNKYENIIGSKLNSLCSPFCPLECDSISYEVISSFNRLPSDRIYFPFKNLTINDSKNLVFFNIFYTDLKYTSISEIVKMYVLDLISNIGGNLGLFIGISFLSFVEIIELIIELILILLKH